MSTTITKSKLCIFFLLITLGLNAQSKGADNGELAIIVAKNGRVISDSYFNGQTAGTLSNVQSLTKSIMSVLIGIAIDQGHIENEDLAINKLLIDEFLNIKNEEKKKITIAHLLNQTSGLAWKGFLEHKEWLSTKDPVGMVLKKKLTSEPGTKYNYNSGATHLLSVILTKAVKMSTFEYAQKYLFSPIGIEEVKWEKRGDYYDGGGLGLEMSAVSLLKIALLLQNKGKMDDFEIISEEWIDKIFDVEHKMKTKWGLRGSAHGYCWYEAIYKGMTIDYGMGYGGQFIFLIPEKELIIIAFHNHDTPKGIKQQNYFLNKRLPEILNHH